LQELKNRWGSTLTGAPAKASNPSNLRDWSLWATCTSKDVLLKRLVFSTKPMLSLIVLHIVMAESRENPASLPVTTRNLGQGLDISSLFELLFASSNDGRKRLPNLEPVANFSTSAWFTAEGRAPCSPGGRASRSEIVDSDIFIFVSPVW
jgi:hypothetical protein